MELFRYHLPLEKGGALNLNKLEFHSPRMVCALQQGCFEPNLLKIGPVILEKIFKFSEGIFAIS